MIAAAQGRATTDRQLANRVTSQLADTNRASLRRLSVDVAGGQVTLRGCVESFYEKQVAIQACRVLDGIDSLIDAVEVSVR